MTPDTVTERELVRFVVREARLLDEKRLDEWLALFAPEGTLKERVTDVAESFSGQAEVGEILDFIREGGDRAVCVPRDAG